MKLFKMTDRNIATTLNVIAWGAACTGIALSYTKKDKTAIAVTCLSIWAAYSGSNVENKIARDAIKAADKAAADLRDMNWSQSIYMQDTKPVELNDEPTEGELRALEVRALLIANPKAEIKETWSELHLGMNPDESRQSFVVWDRQFALADELFAIMHPDLV